MTDAWNAVDHYFADRLLGDDEVLEAALAASEAAGLPPIQVAPTHGKLLHLLARSVGARQILEVGTLGGYSTIWLGRALAPGGRLLSLEIEPRHAEVARANLERAGLSGAVEVRLGPAVETLDALVSAGAGPFDLVFIDADKPSNTDYFERALRLTRPGSLIVVDNVVRGGAVADQSSSDAAVLGVRRLLDFVHGCEAVSATALQTVGQKSYDGFLLALVN